MDTATARIGAKVRRARVYVLWCLAAALSLSGCATCGIDVFLTPGKRAFNALKNRTAIPVAADFDTRASLEAMLAPGDDRDRWSPSRAAAIDGYIVRVHDAGPESANCFAPARLDAHIEIGTRADAPPNQRLIVEVTPPMRDWAAQRGVDWSTATLQRELTGRRVRVEGWLLFDSEHDEEAENTRPGHRDNWRATAWEIHPVTSMTVQAGSSMALLQPTAGDPVVQCRANDH